MYKGEANVPQHMLQSFIRTAESLQIRGLAEGGSKHFDSPDPHHMPPPPPHGMPLFPPHLNATSTPFKAGKTPVSASGSAGGILAARLARMNEEKSLFDLDALMPPARGQGHKRSRKGDSKASEAKRQQGSKGKANNNLPLSQIFSNNNYEEEGALKIDEDADGGKENR